MLGKLLEKTENIHSYMLHLLCLTRVEKEKETIRAATSDYFHYLLIILVSKISENSEKAQDPTSNVFISQLSEHLHQCC